MNNLYFITICLVIFSPFILYVLFALVKHYGGNNGF